MLLCVAVMTRDRFIAPLVDMRDMPSPQISARIPEQYSLGMSIPMTHLQSIAALHYKAFLASLSFQAADGGQISPKDAEDALRCRKEIMENFGWDVSWMSDEEDWDSFYIDAEDGSRSWDASVAPDFGEFPKVPLWVEVFGKSINDCSGQTYETLDDEAQIIQPFFVGFLEGDYDATEYACLIDPDAGLEYEDYFSELLLRRS